MHMKDEAWHVHQPNLRGSAAPRAATRSQTKCRHMCSTSGMRFPAHGHARRRGPIMVICDRDPSAGAAAKAPALVAGAALAVSMAIVA